MAHAQAVRDKLRRLYVFDRISLEVAALQCGVSISTATRWKRDAKATGDDWEKVRAAQVFVSGEVEDIGRSILAGFLTQYHSTMAALTADEALTADKKAAALSSLADSFTKTVAASKKILPETDQLATAMQVIKRLLQFVQEQYPQHGAAFVEILEPFGDVLATELCKK